MKIATACGCGLGTCLLLKMTCERALKEMEITNFNVAHGDLGTMINADCDFFVITSDLEKYFDGSGKKYVSVQNVAGTDEMKEKLQTIIEELNL
ncbi:PTS sugar transporter subunit IIB [Alkalibacter saccharofermentans]|uniref:PTS system, ascorbate-specific IIB component n=1 Tax=Alkalibacter saccharofermentans DSM 14828 TaxID=1120975 RepID=A0A1M4UYG1_9FIRM|nr:PTS sugar transporter subunit IIB [Alkalibacter saccharofermentans]SHE61766.1 PTS system, ascorbate-specific IIB component [Alkalibacter saccharofermentans DSM 14828]